jgi:hypothetical protein
MSYTVDMEQAARRNLAAAHKLAGDGGSRPVAAYLFGIAAECALKFMAQRVQNCRTDEIMYAHFPDLRTLLRDAAQGRYAQDILRIVEPENYMGGWAIKVRYAPSDEVLRRPVDDWAEQAGRTVNAMGAR